MTNTQNPRIVEWVQSISFDINFQFYLRIFFIEIDDFECDFQQFILYAFLIFVMNKQKKSMMMM